MKDYKIIIVGDSDFSRVSEAIKRLSLDRSVIIIGDDPEVEQTIHR